MERVQGRLFSYDNMIRVTTTLLFFFMAGYASAQYFQYSQYNYTMQRINPATVAMSDYASADLIYRNQSTSGENLKSTFLSASYPVLSRKNGKRWSGVGVSLLDDHAAGIFSTQEAGLSYAINITPAKFQSLALGFKGVYHMRSVNLDGLYTGSQYIPDRGFDESMARGENLEFLRSQFFSFSTGVYWQQTDRDQNRLAYWGISFFDFNQAKDLFLGVESQFGSSLVFSGGIRVYENKNLSLMPEILFTRSAAKSVWSIGAVTSYVLPQDVAHQARIDV